AMSSEETEGASPQWGSRPALSKGTLGTWWFHRQRGGRTKSGQSADPGDETRLWPNQRKMGRMGTRTPPKPLPGKARGRKAKASNRTTGNPAVRDYRGASENVTLVEMCTHLATERAGMVTLHLTVGASELYPNSRQWFYNELGLFNGYRVRRPAPKVQPAG